MMIAIFYIKYLPILRYLTSLVSSTVLFFLNLSALPVNKTGDSLEFVKMILGK